MRRWRGQSEDNTIFAFAFLATEVEFHRKDVETKERKVKQKKDTLIEIIFKLFIQYDYAACMMVVLSRAV